MLKYFTAAAVLLLHFAPRSASPCSPSVTTVNGKTVCSQRNESIFFDDFTYFDERKWRVVTEIASDKRSGDFVVFGNSSECRYVRNGRLHIRPQLLEEMPGFDVKAIRHGELTVGDCDHKQPECYRKAFAFRILPPVMSARIQTRLSFRYGVVTVRAKLPKGDWLFPLITLEPASTEYGNSGYRAGQVGIAYILSNEQLVIEEGGQRIDGSMLTVGFIEEDDDNRTTTTGHCINQQHFGNDYHNFTLHWYPGGFTFTIDERACVISLQRPIMAPFDREFHVSLGVSAGGINTFPNECLTGPNHSAKPWDNLDPKGELNFWKDRANWKRTWKGEDAALKVDFVSVSII